MTLLSCSDPQPLDPSHILVNKCTDYKHLGRYFSITESCSLGHHIRSISFTTAILALAMALSLKDIEKELREVSDYYILAVQLDIPTAKVKEIEDNFRHCERRKLEVIDLWLRNAKNPCWTSLATAVEKMGVHANVARSLKQKALEKKESMGNVWFKFIADNMVS